MSRRRSPQTAFLLRALPLLGWERITTDLLLSAFPGAPLQTGVTVTADGTWVLQAPARVNGVTRNIRLVLPPRLPIQLTVGLPLFWAFFLATPWTGRLWKRLLAGSAAVMALPPVGLLAYAAHVVQIYVYPAAPVLLARGIAGLDYVTSTVAPYVAPVLLAVALHPQLGSTILGGTAPAPSPIAAPGRVNP